MSDDSGFRSGRRLRGELRRWMRSCAICGHFLPPIDTYCESCWRELGRRQSRGFSLHQGDRPFPVYSLYSWSREHEPWVSRLIGGFKGGREVRAARLFAELFSHERLGLGDCQPAGFVLPPRSKRQEDHAWALAMEFSRLWKKPILDILTENQGEKGSHRIQKQLTGDQRHERRYRAKDGFELADWSQRGSLILVDDVITSGATAMAAYMALEDPSRFEVWTLVNRPKLAGTGAF